jgi:hypothetical protein
VLPLDNDLLLLVLLLPLPLDHKLLLELLLKWSLDLSKVLLLRHRQDFRHLQPQL